ncbi:hypothetical protein L873DRAFT_1670034 [Choiromyces venosus 120613-1]|uniref:Uncharacterized protein n=1 Tax=Choiromyces venosus 120613-1 TaxID=1336337 RepID=A0A3N4JZC5_9PEZI|nr:hypothetical protein L873DRAFT_1670034 [Choiromyces venosus 120613-1]
MTQIFPTLLRRYDATFAARPLLTMMVTNTLLGAIADTTAQTVTSIRERSLRQPLPPSPSSAAISTAIHTLDNAISEKPLIPQSTQLPPPFDWGRLARFMSWGCIVAPFQFKWFQFLSGRYPISAGKGGGGMGALVKRVGLDQLAFAPVGLAGFFGWMTVSEGGGWGDIKRKFKEVYFDALRSNYMLWPAVQMINFRLIPLKFQLPFASSWGILWGTYLSLTNSAAEV